MSGFLETLIASDGYVGVTHAGIALVADDTGSVLLAQRSANPGDAPDVAETWEFPGGSLDPGEQPFEAALREFLEETGLTIPADAVVTNGWRSADGVYQGFVVNIADYIPLDTWIPTSECQALAWYGPTMVAENENLRPEVRDGTPWDLIFKEYHAMKDTLAASADTIPDEAAQYASIEVLPIPVHGVIAPENTQSGDSRGFSDGSMTKRPLRLPLRDTATDVGQHGGAFVVGSVDRLMRADGLVQFEGVLMPSASTDPLVEKMQFFDGKYGVSVDGDQGSIDMKRTEAEGVLWFDQVRASGLTAVDIPAFHEAHVAFGPHPSMPNDETLAAAAYASGDLIGARSLQFKRGPGWVTDPKATNRIHDYWTKPGEPGYEKVGWGKPGDFARAKALIGAKIAEHSPDKIRFLNQIIAQWHHDALGYWPATHAKMDRAGTKAKASVEVDFSEITDLMTQGLDDLPDAIDPVSDGGSAWEAVLVSSAATAEKVYPPLDYFSEHPDTGALVIEDPDEFGFRRTYGYAAEWGVCHLGFEDRCVNVPEDPTGADYAEFHLGRTRTDQGYINTGLITYGKSHRAAGEMLSQSATQAHFDDIRHAWAAVVLGENARGVWFSGVVLPTVEEKWLTTIEATGQVSGEWKHDALRTLLTVNVPGFPVMRSSAAYDDEGNVLALAASAHSEPYQIAEVPEDAVCMHDDCTFAPEWGVWQTPDVAAMYCNEHYAEHDGAVRNCVDPAEDMALVAAGYAEIEMDLLRESMEGN